MTVRVGLMAPGFSPGDAVSNDLLGMLTALLSRGQETVVFLPTGETTQAYPVMHYADAPLVLNKPDDVLIYHYCVADPAAMAVLQRLRCRILVRYHNVTPASLMSSYSAEFGRVCRIGREMLAMLPDMTIEAFLSDSHYNANELLALGINPLQSRVFPPMHRIEDLLGQPDDPAILRQIDANTYNVLSVGRLAPNKGLDLMAESFAQAMSHGKLDIHLHHVGVHDPRLQLFTDKVGEILVRGGVRQNFTFHGVASTQSLATLYRHSDVFWTMSLHEGFCVPVVEAMAFGLPILSSRSTALPETCGNAAEYANSTDEFARLLLGVLMDDTGRVAMGRRSRERFESTFTNRHIQKRFVTTLDAVLAFGEQRTKASAIDLEGDWFALPHAREMLEAALAVAPPLPVFGLTGKARRTDFVDWILREGWTLSPQVAEYLCGQDFIDYMQDIDVPSAGIHLSADMRLLWRFHRPAHMQFDLLGSQSVSDYWRWYEREGSKLYVRLDYQDTNRHGCGRNTISRLAASMRVVQEPSI